MSFFPKPCDSVRWGRIDLWDVFEASHILADIEPSKDPNAVFEPEADEIYQLMSRSLKVGGLNLVAGPSGQPFLCPLQVITWAEKKGLPIPPDLKSEVVRAAALIIDNQRKKEAPKVSPAGKGYELSEATKNALKRFGGPSSPLPTLPVTASAPIVATQPPHIPTKADRSQPVTTPTRSAPLPPRLNPQGGDTLTPMIWEICYDLRDGDVKPTPMPVMAELKARADSTDKKVKGVLAGSIAGGVKYEDADGDERELNANQLQSRINEWKKKAKIVA
jgi:hypothetical protein